MNKCIFRIGADNVDVENIVREIQDTVQEKIQAGEYPDPTIAQAERHNLSFLQNQDDFMDYYMACLREAVYVDINDFEIRERRQLASRPLIKLKQSIWNMLKFYTYRLWSQQNQANGLIVAAIDGMDQKNQPQDRRTRKTRGGTRTQAWTRPMTPTKRLAFVAPRFPESGTVGGAETLLKNLALHCQLAGYHVDFFTTCATNHFSWANNVPAGSREIDGITVHFFPVNENRDVASFLRIQTSISQKVDVSRQDEETWLRHSVNSDALQSHLRKNQGAYDTLLTGPYLFGITEMVTRVAPDKTYLVPCLHDEPFAYLSIMREMFNRVRGCLFNTNAEYLLAKKLYELQDTCSHVVGMGLEPFHVNSDRIAKLTRHARIAGHPYLLFCGRREPLKGTPVLTDFLHAFRQRTQRDVRLVLTGTGDIEAPDQLRPYIADLGFLSEEDKHAVMAGALAFCHPSPNESLGIVLLESWLAGTPAWSQQRAQYSSNSARTVAAACGSETIQNLSKSYCSCWINRTSHNG